MATSLSRMMKKASASSSVLDPLVNNRSTPIRNFSSAILIPPLKTSTSKLSRQVFRTTAIPPHHRFSALAEDRSILNLIECDLDCAEEKFLEVSKALPKEFPFKIVDNGQKGNITLTREYLGEEIKVAVSEGDEENKGNRESQRVTFLVSILKKNRLTLYLGVKAEATGGITIDYFSVWNPCTDDDNCSNYADYFTDIDEKWQKAFKQYLEVRGFELSNTKFICEYMVQRKKMRCRMLLKDLKTFFSN